MKWNCFFGHDWKEEACSYTSSLRLGWNYETTILFRCKNCCTYKTLTVKGAWKNKIDDDDDDHSDSTPILSPDDYYDRIEK